MKPEVPETMNFMVEEESTESGQDAAKMLCGNPRYGLADLSWV